MTLCVFLPNKYAKGTYFPCISLGIFLYDIGVFYMGFGHWGWMLGVPKSFFGRWVFGRWGFWTLEVLDVGKFWTLKVFGRWGF